MKACDGNCLSCVGAATNYTDCTYSGNYLLTDAGTGNSVCSNCNPQCINCNISADNCTSC